MNNKGFTIIELLAVIMVLGLLLAIAVPKVIDSMNNSKQKAYEAAINNIEKAAAFYVTENSSQFMNDNSFIITLTQLCTDDYLECPVYNPDTEQEINGSVQVTRQADGSFEYEFILAE